MKKRLAAILVSAAMAVSLAACGSSQTAETTAAAAEAETTEETTAAETEAAAETETAAAETEAASADTEAAEAGAAADGPIVTVDEASGRLKDILEAGVLKVATSPDYPPYEFEDLTKDGQDKYAGADMELAKYIADRLGVELEIDAMAFDACMAAVGEGRVDLTLCGMVPKEERRTVMEFSDVYYNDGDQVLVTLAENSDQYKTLADFAGKKVAAQNGTLQYDLVMEQLPDSQCEIISAIPEAVMMLKTGKVDAVALASVSANNYVANYPELVICEPKFEYTSLGVVAGIVKDEPELTDAINKIVNEVIDSEIYFQWIEEASALSNEIQAQ